MYAVRANCSATLARDWPESAGTALKQWNAPVSYRRKEAAGQIHAITQLAQRSSPRATPATWTCQTDSDLDSDAAVLRLDVISKNKIQYRTARIIYGGTLSPSAALPSSSKESRDPRLPGQHIDERRLSRPVTLSVSFKSEGTPENNADERGARCVSES